MDLVFLEVYEQSRHMPRRALNFRTGKGPHSQTHMMPPLKSVSLKTPAWLHIFKAWAFLMILHPWITVGGGIHGLGISGKLEMRTGYFTKNWGGYT